MSDCLNAEFIGNITGKDITVFDCITSTNSVLKECALKKDEGAVYIAKKQTNGRGRSGRSFISPENGIYMSILLKPQNAQTALGVTTMAAVAVANAIEKFSPKKAQIKWVNDVFVDGKKVCGILTEAVTVQNEIAAVVLGIGVNLYKPTGDFDDEIKEIAGAVFDTEQGVKEEFAAEIINGFFEFYSGKPYVDEYRQRSLLNGKLISYEKNGISAQARVIEIDDACRLVVENDGKTECLLSGEVHIKSF